MSLQPPQSDLAKTKLYALVMLLAALVGAGAQALLVPPAWMNSGPPPPPTQEQPPRNSPAPVSSPSTSQFARQQNVCGMWRSETSQKQYNFVCQGQDYFEVYEVSNQGLNKIGSGKITEDGKVEAELLSPTKKRRAHLKLKLSTNGQMLEGPWNGDDPRESGRLTFHRT